MKKILKVISVLLTGAVLLTGCGTGNVSENHSSEKIRVVCTTFPQYDWLKNILGESEDDFELTLLVKNSADVHNYQPSAKDMIAIREADLFVYIGGESDTWAADLMASDASLKEKAVSLVETLGDEALIEEIVEGMTHTHEHSEEDGHIHNDKEHDTVDEHVWLSLNNAEVLCQYLSERVCELSPECAEAFRTNTAAYTEELHALNDQYRDMVNASAKNTLIFGDRFPFRYLTEDYGLEYYAAFAGCNAEVEAGFDTVVFLADKVKELHTSYIMVIDGSDRELAKTISNTANKTDMEILVLDSMQSVSWEDIQQGTNYLDIMKANMEILRKALG